MANASALGATWAAVTVTSFIPATATRLALIATSSDSEVVVVAARAGGLAVRIPVDAELRESVAREVEAAVGEGRAINSDELAADMSTQTPEAEVGDDGCAHG